jgi:hypothetical protein
MSKTLSRLARSLAITVSAVALIASAGAAFVAQPRTAYAAGCDNVNIVYCGLDGSNLSANINSFQSLYNSGTDHGHNDLQAVYNWAGASDAQVKGMNTNNTKLGTMYRNGDIKVGGDVVAHDSWVSARFTEGQGFVQIKDGVWARKTTTSLAEASAPVLVHFDGNGQFNWAVMTGCGNAVKATPVKPAPKPALVCTNLNASVSSDRLTWGFVAKAKATNTSISRYDFDFGDGKTSTVRSTDNSTSVMHTYAKSGTYHSRVTVSGPDVKDATSADCTATVKIAEIVTPQQPSLTCTNLVRSTVAGQKLTYTFTATAAAQNTNITGYVFHFGEGDDATVTSSATTASATHTYTQYDTEYTAFVEVSSASQSGVTSETCKLTFRTPVENAPVALVSEETPAAPTELVNTGPAGIAGLFAGTSVLGAAGHQLIQRRRAKRS